MLSCINFIFRGIMEAYLMQFQSLCVVLIMAFGIMVRRNRKLHIKIMSLAIIWDVILILQIELSRSAILKASKAISNAFALNLHVSIAVLTVVLYGFMIQSGRQILRGQVDTRKKHKILGFTTFSLRILTFVTSFWAVSPKS
jgi:hypothetical protein